MIKNPVTGKNVSIYGKLGQGILANYLEMYQFGGSGGAGSGIAGAGGAVEWTVEEAAGLPKWAVEKSAEATKYAIAAEAEGTSEEARQLRAEAVKLADLAVNLADAIADAIAAEAEGTSEKAHQLYAGAVKLAELAVEESGVVRPHAFGLVHQRVLARVDAIEEGGGGSDIDEEKKRATIASQKAMRLRLERLRLERLRLAHLRARQDVAAQKRAAGIYHRGSTQEFGIRPRQEQTEGRKMVKYKKTRAAALASAARRSGTAAGEGEEAETIQNATKAEDIGDWEMAHQLYARAAVLATAGLAEEAETIKNAMKAADIGDWKMAHQLYAKAAALATAGLAEGGGAVEWTRHFTTYLSLKAHQLHAEAEKLAEAGDGLTAIKHVIAAEDEGTSGEGVHQLDADE